MQLLLCVLVVLLIGCGKPVLRYPNLPLVAQSPVRAGESVILSVERCNDSGKPLSYTVSRTLVRLDSQPNVVMVMPSSTTVIPPGCEKVTSLLNQVPLDTPPGTYEIRAVSHYLYRDRRQESAWTSTPFEVVP